MNDQQQHAQTPTQGIDARDAVSASLVTGDDRMNFLPFYFGTRRMLRGETLVYGWMDRLCRAYGGGYWNFYTLSNGGFYMAPERSDLMRIEVEGNGFNGEMSADAAGVVATLFALCQLAEELHGSDDADSVIENFHLLREFAGGHAEACAIFSAID